MTNFKHWKEELPEEGRPLLYWIGYVKNGKVVDSAYSTGRFFEAYMGEPASFMDWQIQDHYSASNSLYIINHNDSEYLIDNDDLTYFIDLYWKYSEDCYGVNPYTGKEINESVY